MASVIAGILILVGLLAFPFGIAAAFNPRFFRLSSRWYAIPFSLLLFLTAGIGMIISPGGNGADPASTRLGGVVMMAIWAGIVFGARGLANWSRRWAVDAAAAKPIGVLERMAEAYGRAVERERGRRDELRARLADERKRAADQSREYLNAGKYSKRTPPVPFDPHRPGVSSGRSISFEYVDAEGEVTDRDLRNWEIDGAYLHGFCTMRRATRMFRLDRVLEWKDWS